jgi:hypothetical protein
MVSGFFISIVLPNQTLSDKESMKMSMRGFETLALYAEQEISDPTTG